MKRLMTVAMLMLCSSVWASETQRLTFSGIPPSPSVAHRHVRILGTITTFLPGQNPWLGQTWNQNDMRISNRDAAKLSSALYAWLQGSDTDPIWVKQRSLSVAAYDVRVEIAPNDSIQITLFSGSYYTDDEFGTTETANVMARQQMILTHAEAEGLMQALHGWVTGDVDPGVLWTKTLQN